MKRLALSLAFIFWASAALAQYAGVRVVSNCGNPSPWPALQTSYQTFAVWLSVDTTMTLCTIGGGGGGGGNVTIVAPLGSQTLGASVATTTSDGSDVAEGTTTDASTANTLIGLTKAIKASVAAPPLPSGASTAANQEVTAAGTSATSGQGVQGVSGGIPLTGAYKTAGTMQSGVSISSSTALTVPGGSLYAEICVETAAARYTDDGTTTPTGSVGIPVPAGACWQVAGSTLLSNFKIIGSGATIDASYYK